MRRERHFEDFQKIKTHNKMKKKIGKNGFFVFFYVLETTAIENLIHRGCVCPQK